MFFLPLAYFVLDFLPSLSLFHSHFASLLLKFHLCTLTLQWEFHKQQQKKKAKYYYEIRSRF